MTSLFKNCVKWKKNNQLHQLKILSLFKIVSSYLVAGLKNSVNSAQFGDLLRSINARKSEGFTWKYKNVEKTTCVALSSWFVQTIDSNMIKDTIQVQIQIQIWTQKQLQIQIRAKTTCVQTSSGLEELSSINQKQRQIKNHTQKNRGYKRNH